MPSTKPKPAPKRAPAAALRPITQLEITAALQMYDAAVIAANHLQERLTAGAKVQSGKHRIDRWTTGKAVKNFSICCRAGQNVALSGLFIHVSATKEAK